MKDRGEKKKVNKVGESEKEIGRERERSQRDYATNFREFYRDASRVFFFLTSSTTCPRIELPSHKDCRAFEVSGLC